MPPSFGMAVADDDVDDVESVESRSSLHSPLRHSATMGTPSVEARMAWTT